MQKKFHIIIPAAVFALALLISQSSFWGCASTGQQVSQSTAREKAVKDSLYEVHKNELRKYWSFGIEPFRQNDFVKAKKYFRIVAQKDTSGIYTQALYQHLGTCFLRLSQPDSAEWAYKEGLSKNPDNPYFYNILGYLYKVADRTDEAIDMYIRLTQMVPDSATYHENLGQLYVAQGKIDKAIESYQAVVNLKPTDKKSQEILDTLLNQSGDINALIAQREEMLARFPDDMKIRLDLAQSYHRVGDFDKALEQLTVVIAKEPDNILALELMGDAYQQTERFSEAISVYDKIIKNNPKDKKNLCNLALAYASLERYTIAKREVNKALAMDPNYGLAYLTRGFIYEQSAEKCVDKAGGKISYNDKLVYKIAYDEYEKSRRDFETRSEAEKRMKYLETLIPTKEDAFMHPNQKTPQGACYQWIE